MLPNLILKSSLSTSIPSGSLTCLQMQWWNAYRLCQATWSNLKVFLRGSAIHVPMLFCQDKYSHLLDFAGKISLSRLLLSHLILQRWEDHLKGLKVDMCQEEKTAALCQGSPCWSMLAGTPAMPSIYNVFYKNWLRLSHFVLYKCQMVNKTQER